MKSDKNIKKKFFVISRVSTGQCHYQQIVLKQVSIIAENVLFRFVQKKEFVFCMSCNVALCIDDDGRSS